MEAVQKTPEREAFYKKIDGENLSALWNVMGDLITPEPRSACRPHLWKFDAIRDFMTEAGKLITAKEATRRVLVLENPGLRGQSKVTTSLFAGVQMVIPGDIAPAHRHSQSALRFVLEGKGAYTSVDGERTAMEPGDFVITPSMTWHDHSNETSQPMFWLDGLDIPMVQFFDASFAEDSTEDQQKITRPAGDSFGRYGHNLLPVDEKRKSKTSPIFNYPYAYTREALEQAKAAQRVGRLPRPEAEVLQSRDRRLRDADHRHLHPAAAEGLQDRALSLHRRHGVRGDRRQGALADRRADLRVGSARPVRGAELAVGHPRGRRGFGAVQLLRSPGAAEARPVPRRPRQRVSSSLSPRVVPANAGTYNHGVRFAEGISHIALSIDHAVWVPAQGRDDEKS